MIEPTWREDLDSLLATAGEAQWVEEADARLTALLEERDSFYQENLGLRAEVATASSKLEACVKRLDVRYDDDGSGHDEVDRLTAAVQNAEFDLQCRDDMIKDRESRLHTEVERTKYVQECLREVQSKLATTKANLALKTTNLEVIEGRLSAITNSEAWVCDHPNGAVVVLGTREYAETQASTMQAGGIETLMLNGPYELQIGAVEKPFLLSENTHDRSDEENET